MSYPIILMYHSLGDPKHDCPAVSLDSFVYQMDFLRKNKYKVISIYEYFALVLNRKNIPSHCVILTFDDGCKDNIKAARILREFDFSATMFVVSSWIGKDGYLTEDDLLWISRNTKVTIGSHTKSHAYLPDANSEMLADELIGSKKTIKNIICSDVDFFSYPIGGFDERCIKAVKEAGYFCALTTNRGFSEEINMFALRRIKINDRDKGWKLWLKLSGYYNFFKHPKHPY